MSLDLYDYAMERRLREMDPALHRRFTDAVFALQHILSNYQLLFPSFTDHTELHSLTVIDFCNRLIGDQIESMNADEIYSLLMGCYFHDSGMGVSKKDFEAFSRDIDFGDYFETHSREDIPRIIRDYHNEYSGRFIRKYAEFFEIPSEEHLWAIIEISRGHRKISLMDENSYPTSMAVPSGNSLCLPYLAALIRLADEIDVSSSRNSALLYDFKSYTAENVVIEFKRHNAIHELQVMPEAFVLRIQTDEDWVMESILKTVDKMQKTLDDCRHAVLGRTPYVITQKQIVLEKL